MRHFLLAVGLSTGLVAIATPAAAVRTWEGVSVAVPNGETGEAEFYTVRFTLDDTAATYANPIGLIAQNPPVFTPYTINLYNNVTSISVTGPRAEANATLTGGRSRVSTLAPNLSQFGSTPYTIFAGTEGFEPGFAMQFIYYPPTAYASTAMPGSLDVTSSTLGAPGTTYASFNLTRYDYEGDPADENIQPVELLNFFIASGGFLPSATDVPEPATWGMMILGFGVVGASLRRRRVIVTA